METFVHCIKHCLEPKHQKEVPDFGTDMRSTQFHLREGFAFLNAGSHGVCCNTVRQRQNELMELRDENPQQFTGALAFPLVNQARTQLAAFLGADLNDIILVENVTKGVSNILRSLNLKQGEAILVNNFTYGAMINASQALVDRCPGSHMIEVHHNLPITNKSEIIDSYNTVLTENPNIKIALIDHICMAGILFPVAELVDLCKSKGVLTLVDAAHVVGQIRVDLNELDADFYVGTLYKWLHSPIGSGFQWVAKRHHDVIQPAVTSFNYEDPFPTNFRRQGTRDAIPFCTVSEAIDFHHWFGGYAALDQYREEVWNRIRTLVDEKWGAGFLPIPESLRAPAFLLPILPDIPGFPPSRESANVIQGMLYSGYQIQVRVMYFQGFMYTRISMDVYVSYEDCEKLVEAVIDLRMKRLEVEKQEEHGSRSPFPLALVRSKLK